MDEYFYVCIGHSKVFFTLVVIFMTGDEELLGVSSFFFFFVAGGGDDDEKEEERWKNEDACIRVHNTYIHTNIHIHFFLQAAAT